MNKKVWIGAIVVYILMALLDFIVNYVLLAPAYAQSPSLWRPEAEMKTWIFFVNYIFVAFFFTLIFSKGYEGRGIIEGVRYGLYVGLMVSVPMAYGSYAAMPISYSLALQWFIYGTIQYVIYGIAVAAVFGKQATVTPVKPA